MIEGILSELINSNTMGFVFAMVIPILFMIFMVKDVDSKYILSFFCWGVFSVLLAYVLNNMVSLLPEQKYRVTTNIAPIVEETLKALPLLLFLRPKRFSKYLIVYCAMASGIGFSVQETIFYFTSFQNNIGANTLLPLFTRTITTCLMHGMCTAVIGYGLTIAREHRNIREPMMLGLLALSATIHALYNLLIGTRLSIFALIMPAALYFLGLMLLRDDSEDIGGESVNA